MRTNRCPRARVPIAKTCATWPLNHESQMSTMASQMARSLRAQPDQQSRGPGTEFSHLNQKYIIQPATPSDQCLIVVDKFGQFLNHYFVPANSTQFQIIALFPTLHRPTLCIIFNIHRNSPPLAPCSSTVTQGTRDSDLKVNIKEGDKAVTSCFLSDTIDPRLVENR